MLTLTTRTKAAVALAAILACNYATFEECFIHCWQYVLPAEGIQDQDENGYFDTVCTNAHAGAGAMFAPIQSIGYPGKVCNASNDSQAHHETIKKVVLAKLANDLGSLTMTEIETYEDWMETVATWTYFTCVAQLTCNGDFDCDIDPNIPDDQACTQNSAESLCSTYVETVALANLDLDTGPDVPEYGGTSKKSINPETQDCDFKPESTDGFFPGEGDDGDGDGGEGGDDTTGAGAGPFGDIDMLVYCDPQTTCVVDEDLLANVAANFTVFDDEEVRLTAVSISGVGRCAQVSGLDNGEDSKELLDAFGIQNNDLITHVNGTALSSTANVHQVVYDLGGATSWTVTVRRWNGSTWTTLNYSVSLPLTFGP